MDISAFIATFEETSPDPSWPNALTALWFEAMGDWDKAHEMVQDNSAPSCHVHAYLHRKEGDFADEWTAIAQWLLEETG